MPIIPRGAGHRSKRTRAMFKRLVRKVMLSKAILVEMDTKIGLNAKRNVIILTRRKRNTSLLSSNEKMLFRKPIANRTNADREILVKIVASLKCFQIFPPKVRARIAPYLDYMKIDNNRNIIRQGHTPIYVYFILHGEVVAHDLCEDIYTKKSFRRDRFIAGSGDIIGHISFLRGEKRKLTFTAITDIDCLCMDRDSFIKYLLPYVRKAIEAKYLAMKKLYILDTFNTTQQIFVALFGKLKEYQAMETIYYKDRGDFNYTYFIISGQCMILQDLKTKSIKKSNNQKEYFLYQSKAGPHNTQQYNNNFNRRRTIYVIKEMERQTLLPTTSQMSVFQKYSSTSLSPSDIEHFFIDVGTLSYGAMFGLGEPMEDRAIMARTNVQCLLLPRFWLLAKEQNPGNIWQRLQLSFKNVVPSREQLFEYLKMDNKWKKFSKEYITSKLDNERNRTNPTKIEDIPLICRIVEHNLQDHDEEEKSE